MNLLAKGYFNYLVSFSNGTFKTGITASPFYRLQNYIQEANRHSVKVDGYEITSPLENKQTALKIETAFCKIYSFDAIEGHREWFKKDISWASEEYQKEFLSTYDHKQNFTCLSYELNSLWDKHRYYGIRALKNYKERASINKAYEEIKKLASELGTSGSRIRAKLATEIANDMIRVVMQ